MKMGGCAVTALLVLLGALMTSAQYEHAATPGAAPAPAPAPKVVNRYQVIRDCRDVCKDECSQDIDTKCVPIPYDEEVCVDKPYTTFVQQCTKECETRYIAVAPGIALGTPATPPSPAPLLAPTLAPAVAPVSLLVTSSTGPPVGHHRRSLTFVKGKGLEKLEKLEKLKSKGKGKGKSQPLPVAMGRIPKTDCHDVCTEVPKVEYKPECSMITKYNQECTDYIHDECRKVCTPVCEETKVVIPTTVSKGKGYKSKGRRKLQKH